ncbi:MAG: hypothetical protein KY475_08415 [Planctomycetes bacterium]|nr:hypothetical protein [Planctomycetota bacterium]
MTTANPQLAEALETLEQRLETPIVPGELRDWIEEAAEAADRVETLLKSQLNDTHGKLLAEIREQDEGLAPRVEQLQEDDARLREQLAEVVQIAHALRNAEDRVEPDEQLASEATSELVDKGLELVIAARKQETAIATWYVESFERDRGVVD